MTIDLRTALEDERAWWALVEARLPHIRRFLVWAADCESGGPETSLRFEHRPDIHHCRDVLGHFNEAWWGVVVYSCFDSVTGAERAASRFRTPMSPAEAERALEAIAFPRGSVGGHRRQSHGMTGAKFSLVSACAKATGLKRILLEPEPGFDERLAALEEVGVHWWGRTTYFDVLTRAGSIPECGPAYRPADAHLLGSTGPAEGFEQVWGVSVGSGNDRDCENLLRRWTHHWDEMTDRAAVTWPGAAYDNADFENALCVFQEPSHKAPPEAAANKQSLARHGFRKWC